MRYFVREAIVAPASWKQVLRTGNSKKEIEMSEMYVVNMKFTSVSNEYLHHFINISSISFKQENNHSADDSKCTKMDTEKS